MSDWVFIYQILENDKFHQRCGGSCKDETDLRFQYRKQNVRSNKLWFQNFSSPNTKQDINILSNNHNDIDVSNKIVRGGRSFVYGGPCAWGHTESHFSLEVKLMNRGQVLHSIHIDEEILLQSLWINLMLFWAIVHYKHVNCVYEMAYKSNGTESQMNYNHSEFSLYLDTGLRKRIHGHPTGMFYCT